MDGEHSEEARQAGTFDVLQGGRQRAEVLHVPAASGFRRVRLGLYHCPEAVRGQLLCGRVHHQLSAQLHAHPHDAVVHVGAGVLFAKEDAAAESVVLQSEGADHLHENGEHDRGDVWVLVKGINGAVCCYYWGRRNLLIGN